MKTKIYKEESSFDSTYFYFKYKGKKVSLFENTLGLWVASGFCLQVEADTKEQAIERYKNAHN